MNGKRDEIKLYKKYLKELVKVVSDAVEALDKVMQQPSTFERGKKIAQISNTLDVAKDIARHFGLGEKLLEATNE